jgi:hypothetical protein
VIIQLQVLQQTTRQVKTVNLLSIYQVSHLVFSIFSLKSKKNQKLRVIKTINHTFHLLQCLSKIKFPILEKLMLQWVIIPGLKYITITQLYNTPSISQQVCSIYFKGRKATEKSKSHHKDATLISLSNKRIKAIHRVSYASIFCENNKMHITFID